MRYALESTTFSKDPYKEIKKMIDQLINDLLFLFDTNIQFLTFALIATLGIIIIIRR